MENMNLIHGDCLEELKKIADKSVDFVYTDLPYNQTACKWDQNVIDLDALWVELKRIAKNDRTPFFFSCTTRFGYNLIKANEKWFRWDLVWKKNRAAGFLNAYKLPMRKHEMIYCFAKKTPEYDVSSHREYVEEKLPDRIQNDLYGEYPNVNRKRHKDPLPTSVIPPSEEHELVYCFAKKCPEYDVSSHEEGGVKKGTEDFGAFQADLYNKGIHTKGKTHKDPLPTSVIPPSEEHELVYCFAKKCPEYDVTSHKTGKTKTGNSKGDIYLKEFQSRGQDESYYDKDHTKQLLSEPLPTSDITPPTPEHELVYCFAKKCPEYDVTSHKEYTEKKGEYINATESQSTNSKCKTTKTTSKTHKDPLPTSDITPPTPEHELVYCFAKKCPEYDVSSHKDYVEDKKAHGHHEIYGEIKNHKPKGKTHKDPLPTSDITIDIDIDEQPPSSWCEVNNDERTGHRTAKPVALMEFLLKYWTKPGWTVLDPTMGSGSMGIACKKMGRKFIGMELDDDIYKLAQKRIGDTVVPPL